MKIDADHWEIYKERVRSRVVVVEDSKLKVLSEKIEQGEALRVIVDGRVAMVSGRRIDDNLVRQAINLAKVSQNELSEFPSPEKLDKVMIYDKRVEKLDADALKDVGESIAGVGSISSSQFSVEVIEREITNSEGVEYEERETSVSVFVEAVFKNGSAYEHHESRKFDFSPEEYAERALNLAKIDSRAEKIETKAYEVTLSPIAVDQLLSNALYPAFYFENIKRGRSMIGQLLGKDVFGELTITDDPLIHWGVNSCSFDDEGVRARKTTLVERGVVKAYISDLNHSPDVLTGNGFRENIASYPSTNPTNILLEHKEKGERSELYIHAFIGAHTSNFVSGEFSLKLMNASIDGKGIKGAMIYGNVYELLSKISHFAGKERQVGYTISPEVVIGDVVVKC